ncbi:MAG: peroxide stress protein YaaA, partial [Nocardioidaceae bacterium]
DMRSGMYASVWRPTKEQARRVVSVRVLHEVAGARLVVSHFNKATKGRIVRGLLEDGANPKTPAALVRKLTDLGWIVEPTPGMPGSVDVIVTEV